MSHLVPTECRYCDSPVKQKENTWECIDPKCGFAWTWASWGKELSRRVIAAETELLQLQKKMSQAPIMCHHNNRIIICEVCNTKALTDAEIKIQKLVRVLLECVKKEYYDHQMDVAREALKSFV